MTNWFQRNLRNGFLLEISGVALALTGAYLGRRNARRLLRQ